MLCYIEEKNSAFYDSKQTYRCTISFPFFQGRQGQIMHLYRSFAFLLSRMMTENGGYFVCRTRHLVLAGSSRVSKI